MINCKHYELKMRSVEKSDGGKFCQGGTQRSKEIDQSVEEIQNHRNIEIQKLKCGGIIEIYKLECGGNIEIQKLECGGNIEIQNVAQCE